MRYVMCMHLFYSCEIFRSPHLLTFHVLCVEFFAIFLFILRLPYVFFVSLVQQNEDVEKMIVAIKLHTKNVF